MAANQVAELAEEVDPVLSFFAYQPLKATANPGDSKCSTVPAIPKILQDRTSLVLLMALIINIYIVSYTHVCIQIQNFRFHSVTFTALKIVRNGIFSEAPERHHQYCVTAIDFRPFHIPSSGFMCDRNCWSHTLASDLVSSSIIIEGSFRSSHYTECD